MPKNKKKQPKRIIVPRTHNAGTMTESQYFSKIRSGLRQTFRWWKPLQKALDLASRPNKSKNKRLKKEYQCAHCKHWFKRADVEVDHIIECGSLSCYEDIVPFIQRLSAEDANAYQVLCKPCHKIKTAEYKIKQK
jgi:5-methylcytosine-specific restriction endonuclease McrA